MNLDFNFNGLTKLSAWWKQIKSNLQAIQTEFNSHKTATTLDHPDKSVSTSKIADYAVTQNKLAQAAVANNRIQNGAVDARCLASGAVTSDKIVSGAVTSAKLAAGAVTLDKINSETKKSILNVSQGENCSSFASVDNSGTWICVSNPTDDNPGIDEYYMSCRIATSVGNGGIQEIQLAIPLSGYDFSLYIRTKQPNGDWSGWNTQSNRIALCSDSINEPAKTATMQIGSEPFSNGCLLAITFMDGLGNIDTTLSINNGAARHITYDGLHTLDNLTEPPLAGLGTLLLMYDLNNGQYIIINDIPGKPIELPIASTDKVGGIKLYSSNGQNRSGLTVYDDGSALVNVNANYGLTQSQDGKVIIAAATEAEIKAGGNGYKPLVPATLRYAIWHNTVPCAYAVCTDGASVQQKSAWVEESQDGAGKFELKDGMRAIVKFTQGHSAVKSSISIDGTGAKYINYNGIDYFDSWSYAPVLQGGTLELMYDADKDEYTAIGLNTADESIRNGSDIAGLKRNTAVCNTAKTTAAKTATLPGFTLTDGAWAHVRFKNGLSAGQAITLNINGTGAKDVKVNEIDYWGDSGTGGTGLDLTLTLVYDSSADAYMVSGGDYMFALDLDEQEIEKLRADVNAIVDDDSITSTTTYSSSKIERRLNDVVKTMCDGKIYGVKFPLYTTSGTPLGTRTEAAIGMTAAVSTDTVAAVNDFDFVPIFRNVMVNGYLGDDGEFVETAIEGDPNFARDGSNGDVYSRFRLSYFRYIFDDEYEELQVTDTYRTNEGWCPFGVFIRPDGSPRPYAYIAAYEMGYGADSFAASISGVPVAHNTYTNRNSTTAGLSHNTQRTEISKKGTQYCGMTTREVAFLQFLFYVEFATRNSQDVMQGAASFNSQLQPSVAETGVTRVILSNTNASKFPVGCTVSVGVASSGSIDRGSSSMNSIVNRRRVVSKEAYDDNNTALNLEVDEPFDTTTDCYISAMPWYTGMTDSVKGSSGSYTSNANGYYPMKYRGVENLYGNVWTIMSDVIVSDYVPYICYDNTKYQNAPNDDYSAVGYTVCTSNGYVREMGYDADHPGVRLPTVVGGSSTTYYCDNYAVIPGINIALIFGGSANSYAYTGLSCWQANQAVSAVHWTMASRLSVSGQSRAITESN